eukprot:403369875
MEISKSKICIIGAGPVGYLLSILLTQRGYKIDIFEKRSDPLLTEQFSEGRSTNFLFGKRSMEALSRAGIKDEIMKYAYRIEKIKFVLDNLDSYTTYFGGKTVQDRSFSINRQIVQKVLAQRTRDFPDSINIHYNSKVTNVDIEKGSIDVQFQDGQTQTLDYYDQIFAADGTFSVVKNAFLQIPGFSYSNQYSGYGYCELQIPAAEQNTQLNVNSDSQNIDSQQNLQQNQLTNSKKGDANPSRFRIDDHTFQHWPRKDLDMHMWGMPNYQGDINIGLYLKVKGENSYEQFKDDYEGFENFMHQHYPDSKYLMSNMKQFHSNWSLTRLMNMKCSPWSFGKFQLIGDSAHTMNPFLGQGFNGGAEECVIIDDLIQKHQGYWNQVREQFYILRKNETDIMNDLSDVQFAFFKDKFFLPEVQVSFMISDYLSRNYGDIYQSQIQLIRWTTLDYNKCLSRGAVQQALIKDLRESIPDIMVLVKKNKKDQRVSAIVSKYTDVYDITELQKQKLQDASHTIQQKHFENLYEKYMPTYEKLSPKL